MSPLKWTFYDQIRLGGPATSLTPHSNLKFLILKIQGLLPSYIYSAEDL